MDEINEKLIKQFLLRVRQEGFTLEEKPPRSVASEVNIDIYRGATKIATFDDRQLGEWKLRVRTDDSTREDIKHDYYKLHDTFIYLRDLYMLYDAAEPLKGYVDSLGYRSIMEYNGCTLAVNARNIFGELEFGTFITGSRPTLFGGSTKTIRDNIYFDMDNYPAAKLSFVARSGILPKEQLITPENLQYLHGACCKTMDAEWHTPDDDTKAALGGIISSLEKVQDSFNEVNRRILPVPAQSVQFIEAKILDTGGLFSKLQIDRESLPKGLFAYDITFSRETMEPEKVWPKNTDSRFGTVITNKPLTIGEKGYTDFGCKDFSLNPKKKYTLQEFYSEISSRDKSKDKTPEAEKPSLLGRLDKKAEAIRQNAAQAAKKTPRNDRKKEIGE